MRIEERFPDDSSIDRYASVNDAILATEIGALKDGVSRVERNQLTTGRVIWTVLSINGALAAIVGVIVATVIQVTK